MLNEECKEKGGVKFSQVFGCCCQKSVCRINDAWSLWEIVNSYDLGSEKEEEREKLEETKKKSKNKLSFDTVSNLIHAEI